MTALDRLTALRRVMAEAGTDVLLVRRETSLQDAVTRYVDQHENLASLKDDLVAAALAIEAEVEKRTSEA